MVFLVPTIQRGNAYPGGSSSKWLIAEMILTVPALERGNQKKIYIQSTMDANNLIKAVRRISGTPRNAPNVEP
jgi:hypothetical protein